MSAQDLPLVQFRFEGEVIPWCGPSPFFFVAVPQNHADQLKGAVKAVSYGWGVATVEAQIGDVVFTTSLFPKDGTYLLPLKAAVRRQAEITAGHRVAVELTIPSVQR